jgi:putative ABC transport system permease protein
LTQDANDNIMMSVMGDDDYDSIDTTGAKARLGLFPAVVSNPNAADAESTKEEVYAFGVDNGSFIAPDITLGDYEAVADDALADLGYEVGDTLKIAGTDIEWTLVGFNVDSTYQTAPSSTSTSRRGKHTVSGRPCRYLYSAPRSSRAR